MKVGRPDKYSKEMFTQFVTEKPVTPDRVRHLVEMRFGVVPSWNTVLKHLEKAVEEGEICRGKVGIYNIFYRKEADDEKD